MVTGIYETNNALVSLWDLAYLRFNLLESAQTLSSAQIV
jgi:hypothetical protein